MDKMSKREIFWRVMAIVLLVIVVGWLMYWMNPGAQ
jgi:cell division septal protein FtsQ